MQSQIDACISNGRAEFEVFVLQAYTPVLRNGDWLHWCLPGRAIRLS
ncbi:hypothetical protein BS78_10G227400 [Paspalum vaginatum]|nr:hypothetical protein BS78_10G227400 [Paspalum vaginatum]